MLSNRSQKLKHSETLFLFRAVSPNCANSYFQYGRLRSKLITPVDLIMPVGFEHNQRIFTLLLVFLVHKGKKRLHLYLQASRYCQKLLHII